jgi:hypothetical protein
MATIRWEAEAAGGVGERSNEFFVHDGKGEISVQKGPSPTWDWRPSEAGTYRVKVVVRDSLGNTVESGWSPQYKVVPKLVISSLSPDKPAPQAAEMATIRWKADAAGGVGKRSYTFWSFDGKVEESMQKGPSPTWDWRPAEVGTFQVKVVVRDSLGNTVESGWSPAYLVVPKLVVSSLSPDKPAPQAAEMATVRWRAEVTGGVGERSFEFRIFDGREEKAAQTGQSGLWYWAPGEPGTYRVKTVVRDSIGNTVESGWSPEYVVVPKLVVKSFSPDKVSPQAAGMATVRWKIETAGGVGEPSFEFLLHDGKSERTARAGSSSTWDWAPEEAGRYRARAVVRDSIGNTVESGWSPEYVVAPPLVASLLSPDKVSPQAAEMATIRWRVESGGGVGGHTIEFRVSDGKEETAAQRGPSPAWDWKPMEPGTYRIKTVVRDSIGNTVESGWSPEYVVVPKLVVSSLVPDNPSPQPALLSGIRWTAEASGGVKDHTYTFWAFDREEEKIVQSGPSAIWEWSPGKPGIYRVKVVVRDSIGNTAEGGWSPGYAIGPPLSEKSRFAVMPMENLSGTAVPLKQMMQSLKDTFTSKGFNILEDEALEKFMERHRVRYTGGLPRELGKAFLEEAGTKAVLFLSIDQFDDADPPKIALSARLVSTGQKTVILWMDGVALAGNESPGVLGIGLVHDSWKLWNEAREKLADSLAGYLAGKKLRDGPKGGSGTGKAAGIRGKFRPKDFFRVPPKPAAGREALRIAVLPFFNESTRRNAGEIMALHFVNSLSERERLEVVEPGVVRQVLLMSRTIMEGGLSLPQADLLRELLDVDLVLTGNVFEYEDYSGPSGSPKVNFTALVYDTKTRQVGWSSISYNRGDDRVFFFNLGKVHTAHAMASEMARALAGMMSP